MISPDFPSLRRSTTAKRAIFLPTSWLVRESTQTCDGRGVGSSAVSRSDGWSAPADRPASANRGSCDTELRHFRLQRRPLHAESGSGARRTAHEPLRFLEGLANMLTL